MTLFRKIHHLYLTTSVTSIVKSIHHLCISSLIIMYPHISPYIVIYHPFILVPLFSFDEEFHSLHKLLHFLTRVHSAAKLLFYLSLFNCHMFINTRGIFAFSIKFFVNLDFIMFYNMYFEVKL